MPEFSACYFCGTALDAPLDEYPVVPTALHPTTEQQRTVVLCPSCRNKLGAVVETVVDAVDDSPEEISVQQALDETSANGSYTENDDENIAAERLDTGATSPEPDVTPAESDTTTSGVSAADEEPLDTAEETGRTPDGESGFEFEGDESESAPADEVAGEPESREADETSNVDLTAAEEQARAAAESSEAAPEGEDGSKGEDGPEDEDSADTEATPEREDSPESEGDDSDETAVADDPQMTALEYNKVMRLLQNREFPVDREEFKVVATNAYQLGDDEFEAVIEAADKRDLIGLEGGKIVES